MLRYRAIIGVVLSAVGAALGAQSPGPGPFVIDRWNTETGLPQNSVNAILQTRDGYLWLATLGGIARFDGTAFASITSGDRPGLNSDRTLALAEDRDGRLWIGTASGLSRYDRTRHTIKTFTVADGLPDDFVSAVAAHPDGSVWFGTHTGAIGVIDAAGVHRVVPANGALGTNVTALAVDTDGMVWVGATTGLWRVDARSHATTQVRIRNSADPQQALATDPRGGVWFATDSGIAHGSRDGVRSYRLPRPPGFDPGTIHRIATSGDGVLWLAAASGAVWRFQVDSGTVLAVMSPESSNATSLTVDREGSLWVGNRVTGLARVRQSVFQILTAADGLAHDNAAGIFTDAKGRMWIGARCKGAAVLTGQTARTLADGERLNCVWTFAEDTTGAIWMAGSGVGRWRAGAFEAFGDRDGLPAHDMRALYRDRAGTMWIGGHDVLASWDGAHFTLYAGHGLDGPPDVRTIAQAHDGTLWFGGEQGLLHYANGAFQLFSTARGLPAAEVRDIHEDSTGALWVATYGGGLARVRNDSIRTFTTADGLFDNSLSSVTDDGAGNLWLSSNRGVFRVSQRELGDFVAGRVRKLHSIAYGGVDGMLSTETNGGFEHAVTRTADGRLWYPTLRGVAVIDPRTAIRATPPAVSIESLTVNGVARATDSALSLGPGRADIVIAYSGLSLTTPNAVTFRYRLDPWDADWIDAGTRRTASYSRVTPGTYRFRVMAANRDGVWSAAAVEPAFTVRPYIWQAWWFRVLATLVLVALAGLTYQARMRAVRAATEAAEREAARVRITQVLEQKATVLAENLRLKEDVERISRHDLRTPLTSVISLAQIVRDDPDLPAQHHASLQLIEQAGYRVLNMANLTLDLFKMEQGTYRLVPRPVDILAVLERSLTDLQALIRTREVVCQITLGDQGGRPRILGDELLAHSMLTNLIKNAIEASPPRGRVAIEVTDGAHVRIRIHNAGVIPRAIRERFFEKYTTSDKTGGTGLGAYSARLMAETQGGSIRVETSDEHGTTVIVELLAAPAAEPARVASLARDEAVSPLAPAETWPERTILVVDDDPSSRAILRHLLAHPRWTVDEAENGPLAIRRVVDGPYDVIFVDVEMPVMDGTKVAERVRELERDRADAGRRPVILVALSSHDDAATPDRAFRSGCDYYLTKPVTRIDVVRVVLGGSGAADVPIVDADIRPLIPSFLEAKRAEVDQLREAVMRGDAEAARRLSHRLRGSFSLYGFGEAAGLCAEVEELTGSDRLGEVGDRVVRLQAHVVRAASRYPSPQTQEA